MRTLAGLIVASTFLALPSASGAVPLGTSLQSAGYKKLTVRDGVTVYKHAKSGKLAAEGIFPGKPEQVLKALLAYDRHKSFNKRISHSKVFSRGARWLLVYQRLKLPVISNRDYTLYVNWGKRGKKVVWLNFWTANTRGPKPQSGYVRIKTHRGGWQLEALPGGRTFARYEVKIDLGGWVPGFLARSGTKKELPKVFAGLRRLVEIPPGQRAAQK